MRSTSIAAIEVEIPSLRFSQKRVEGRESHPVLECAFALTPEEKAAFSEDLKFLDAAQVRRLLLDAVQHAAAQARLAQQSQPAVASPLPHDEAALQPDPSSTIFPKTQTLSDNNVPTPPPAVSAAECLQRLRRLHDDLSLQNRHTELPRLAAMFTPEQLKAKLDWVVARPRWAMDKRGTTALGFERNFLLIPSVAPPE